MNKRKWVIAFMAVAAVICGIMLYKNADRGYSSSLSMGCSAIEYVQEEEIGYFTIVYGSKEHIVRVEDAALQRKITENGLQDVIGVNLSLDVPAKVSREYNLGQWSNTFDLVDTGKYDEYLTLQDVFIDK